MSDNAKERTGLTGDDIPEDAVSLDMWKALNDPKFFGLVLFFLAEVWSDRNREKQEGEVYEQ